MAVVLSVSCTQELRNLMKEKQISPSEALKVGVKALINQPYKPNPTEHIEQESYKAKLEKVQRTMQAHIDKLDEELAEVGK